MKFEINPKIAALMFELKDNKNLSFNFILEKAIKDLHKTYFNQTKGQNDHDQKPNKSNTTE